MTALTLLRDATIFAPEPLGRGDVLVGGGTILAVGADLPRPDPALCAVVELGGARLVPGLVDAHAHLTGGGGEAGPSTRVPRLALTDLTRAGVTTVVGVLGTDGTTRSMADLVATVLGLRVEGLSAYCWTGSYELPLRTLTGSVRTDLCFVDPILGVGELAVSDHRSSQPTFDELLRVASDCHVGGMMSGKAGVLHLHLGDGPRGLELVRRALDETELPARVFHPTHVNRQPRLFEEALALAARGVTIDVTAFPVDEGDPALTAEAAIRRFVDAGLPADRITCSSDGGGCLPTFDAHGHVCAMDVGRPAALVETLRALVDGGMPLERALPPFTTSVARLLRLGGKGRIAPGADADLVVLDAACRVRDVMARGVFHFREGQPLVTGTFETRTPRATT